MRITANCDAAQREFIVNAVTDSVSRMLDAGGLINISTAWFVDRLLKRTDSLAAGAIDL